MSKSSIAPATPAIKSDDMIQASKYLEQASALLEALGQGGLDSPSQFTPRVLIGLADELVKKAQGIVLTEIGE